MSKASIFTPPPQFNAWVGGIVLWFWWGTSFVLSAQEYVWTGGGADALFTTPANWGGNTVFTQNSFSLIRNQVNRPIFLPEGAYGQISGFDIHNVSITIGGKVDSFTTKTSARYNGFWMRGNVTLTLLPSAEYNMYIEGPEGEWKGTDAQLTMHNGNNTIHKQENGTLAFRRMFISGSDAAGYHNIFNQHAGTVTATELWVGTYTSDFNAEPSQYNLYGGTVRSLKTGIQSDTRGCNGRGELHIYGGSFATETLLGGRSTFGDRTYIGAVTLHLGETSAEGFGTFEVTGSSTYNGNVAISVDAPLLALSPAIAETNLVNFAGNIHENMEFTANSSLIAISDDKKTASLDTSKNVGPTHGYTVGNSLSFDESTRVGYLSIHASQDPYTMLLATTGFASEADIANFADWLNESVESYSVVPYGLDSLKLETFTANEEMVFLWDFSNYSADVGVLGISTQHVPEPHTWTLALLAIAFYGGRSYAKKWFYTR